MVQREPPANPASDAAAMPPRDAIRRLYRGDEAALAERLLGEAALPAESASRVEATARELVQAVRAALRRQGGIDAFLHEYDLSSREGIVLMSLAEALLRIPDRDTADRLIRDKIVAADWERHLGKSESVFVNASTWALMLTGRVLEPSEVPHGGLGGILGRLIAKSGEPVIRQAVNQAMRLLGQQFVLGTNMADALRRAQDFEHKGYRFSYDMLGESARTMADAERYFAAYARAIAAIGEAAGGLGPVRGPGISIKLSALDPRYEFGQHRQVMSRLLPRLTELAQQAKAADIGLTIDAEEADRLELSLDLLAELAANPDFAGWDGLGLALQAYQKRATAVADWLIDLARRQRRRLMVRLVKGAYWDTEIKRSQVQGLKDYPVFTRKLATDVSYLACARRLLAAPEAIYPQFASHNAHTLAAMLELGAEHKSFEFQRLHGMGEALYEAARERFPDRVACRIYAPVGTHKDLLAYLVRRLLENGANTSFVNRLSDAALPVEEIAADPVASLRATEPKANPRIPLPRDLYGALRRNSAGLDLSDPLALAELQAGLRLAASRDWQAAPALAGSHAAGEAKPMLDPSDRRNRIGGVIEANEAEVDGALDQAVAAAAGWDAAGADSRAATLERAADLFEQEMPSLIYLAVREAGKTLADAVAEVREAVDYCRYYAARARADFAAPTHLPGPTGERNELSLHGRGCFACISPWNFPLAIFTGQVGAALAAGNSVLAKPAEQTPIIATLAVALLHQAGVPADVLQLLPGAGRTLGRRLGADRRVAGIAFTGGTETAQAINQALAARGGPIVPLIAETGGQNAMIADSSALPEQLVGDVLSSAFGSAGQRCSALRVLFLQREVADPVIAMLAGAMQELKGGDPMQLATDFGPIIDDAARTRLEHHAQRMHRDGIHIQTVALPPACAYGSFFAPRAFEIDRLSRLEHEVFGPILHVIRYDAAHLDRVIAAINRTGYGLTLGIHSRIDERVRYLCDRLRVGNIYVNRGMIGAVVGVQPFGGEGLSGTGPKAGGPHYLQRFATERVRSTDTTAAGGNATLMSMRDG